MSSVITRKILSAPSALEGGERLIQGALMQAWLDQQRTSAQLVRIPPVLGCPCQQTSAANHLKNTLLTEAQAELNRKKINPDPAFQGLRLPRYVLGFEWVGTNYHLQERRPLYFTFAAQAGMPAQTVKFLRDPVWIPKSDFAVAFKTPLDGVTECVLTLSRKELLTIYQAYGADPQVRGEAGAAINGLSAHRHPHPETQGP